MKKGSGGTFTLKPSGAEPVELDLLELKKADLVVRALNHKLRLSILKLLAEKPKSPVTSIYVKLKLEQSVASQHLAIMRRAGIVKSERDGKFIYYSINTARILEIQKLSKKLAG
ncbi:MAG: metalloregulator ArsR/SmtB family transcription factor [Chitinophagaceae bacterium]